MPISKEHFPKTVTDRQKCLFFFLVLNMTEFQKYIQRYLDLIPSENWISHLQLVGSETELFFESLSEEAADFSYGEGKWSLRVLLQHLIDAEKIYAYRALRFSRKDTTELAGWDEEMYARSSNAADYEVDDLLDEFRAVRKLSILFFQHANSGMLLQKGIANNNELTVETIGKLIVGHNIHHLNIIRERYLPKMNIS